MKKKSTALLAILMAANSALAASASADTSATTVADAAPKLIDRLVLSYYGAYSGPSITHWDRYTNDSDARGYVGANQGGEIQNLSSVITLGYKIKPNLVLTGNYAFIINPIAK